MPRRQGLEELRVSVEPELGERIAGDAVCVRPGFPLRLGKVQRPLLPEETLRRDRLLDWLAFRKRRRLTCVVAEAGFGKTTLVADFLLRSRRRVFWYRLDEDDTDGLAFMRYLVAACQAVDPRLLRRAASIMNETAIEPLRQETVLETLLTELDALGEVPSALVLDDLHVIEDNASIMSVVEQVLSRIPGQLSVFIISRRSPRLQLAALRARGEMAELGRDDLRFDEAETERLFRDVYRHPLETDVLHDLQARTEGWAASLRLVGTAVEGRTPGQVRAFVSSLTGSEGHLYDYLAQEVIGELDERLRAFLMRTSLLEELDPGSAAVASGMDSHEARLLLTRCQELGLVSRGAGEGGMWRAHPLVRDFLAARLEAEVGAEGIGELHRHLASAFEAESWRLAARHWAAAGDADQVRRVLCGAVPAIIGSGDLAVAADLMVRFPDPDNPYYALLHSRKLSSEGEHDQALEAARPAFEMSEELALTEPALVAMCALSKIQLGMNRDDPPMRVAGTEALASFGDPELAGIAIASERVAGTWEDGSLDDASCSLKELVLLNRASGHRRHEAITLLNLCATEANRGNHETAIDIGRAALVVLATTSSPGDLSACHANLARSLAHLGHIEAWASSARLVVASLGKAPGWPDVGPAAEMAELKLMYGDPAAGGRLLDSIRAACGAHPDDAYLALQQVRLRMLEGAPVATAEWARTSDRTFLIVAFRSAVKSLKAQFLAYFGAPRSELDSVLDDALAFSASQQAWFWWRNIRLTKALVADNEELNAHVHTLEKQDSGYLSVQAELVGRRFADLDQKAFEIVRTEAILRPERWRWALRQLFAYPAARPGDIKRAAELMELVGSAEDIGLLRTLARKKSLRIPDAGRALAKRLAPRAYVEDLGRVSIRMGDRVVAGTEIRKKVLSLLVFLLTRPQMTATREQVIDALWPEMEPEAGANSLNQTAYFLRQLFEPKADDDSTAGYLNCKADLMWLDRDLVRSRSGECLDLISATRRDPSPDLVSRLAETYTGRFAVDFIYDEWASAFRDTMHAGYLDRVERSIEMDTKAGFFDRAIGVAHLALAADPEAEQIELQLLKLYRLTGAHAAAAEQYAHYAAVMREQLGVEPPPLESI